MAQLITIAEAQEQVRNWDTNVVPDLGMKAAHASAIVIDYLKSRAHKRAVIVSSSVANPTVLTTEEAHLFADGDTVILADHEDSDPSLSGEYVISNATEFTFTVPVTVTVAGTGGTAIVEWTSETVPEHVKAAVLLTLEDLYERRKIDWESLRRLLERSRDPAFA